MNAIDTDDFDPANALANKPRLKKPITNSRFEQDERGKPIVVPLPMQDIIAQIREACDNWPRRIGNRLFVCNDDGSVHWLPKASHLFGWIGSLTQRPPCWARSDRHHSQEQVLHELERLATNYVAVESLPHDPPLPDHFYSCEIPQPGDGSSLRKLVGRFNPATPIDGDLIEAMFATAFWGGPGGARPAFVITSDAGRGAGKSTLANMVGRLLGGVVDVSQNEDVNQVKTRLLSPDGRVKRVVLLDNLKSHRLSWAELEALITSATISGKQLYNGEGARPNSLVWILTLNGVSLSKDLAQRCVIIKLERATGSGSWLDETHRFIDENRTAIIADCIALLRRQGHPLRKYNRWSAWEQAVLERLHEPAEAQQVIAERQCVADVDNEEAAIITDFFKQRLLALRYRPDEQRICIPKRTVAEWYRLATNEKETDIRIGKKLEQLMDERSLPNFKPCSRKDVEGGRCIYWVGDNAQGDAHDITDLFARLDRERIP